MNASAYKRQRARTQEVLGSFVTLKEFRMLIKKSADIASSEITPRNVYLNRRSFLVGAAAAGAAAAAGLSLYNRLSSPVITQASAKIDGIQKSKFSTSESLTPYKDVTTSG
jgi:sulfoxide reductase catalytic subunit YedY